MILIIRGHLRDSLESSNLYELVKDMYKINRKLKIFIHTWSIYASNLSWRPIEADNRPVTKEIIGDYFGDLSHLINHIIIDDDSKIKLKGNLKGKINNGLTQILAWKNYWYGKNRIIEDIHERNVDMNELIINMIFDLLKNSNNFTKIDIIDLIKKNRGQKFKKNAFIVDNECNGVDNVYVGNIFTMYTLITHFNNNLDDILSKNTDTIHQERLVYRINNQLFI